MIEWTKKWGVSSEAVEELRSILFLKQQALILNANARTESEIQAYVRLHASKNGSRLWRNNSGAMYDARGNFIRFGLGNESAKLNSVIKSADLIGIRPILITEKHVGKIIGQFLSYEIKTKFSKTAKSRLKAQKNWKNLIENFGGDARIITNT